MSKKSKIKNKPLLKEAIVKRWGKMAGLNENAGFASKLDEMYPEQLEEMPEEMPEEDPMMGDETPMGDEMPMGDEDPMGGEGMGDEALVQDIVSAVADAIEGVTGVEVSVSGAGGEEASMPAMEPEMGGGEELPMGDEEEPMLELNGFDEKAPKPRKENLPGTPMDGGSVTEAEVKEGEEVVEEAEDLEEDDEKLEEDTDTLSTITPETRDFSGGSPMPQGSVTEAKKKARAKLVSEVVSRVVARLKKSK
jgi:hypothetical protein